MANPFQKHYGETKTVLTKKEFKEAVTGGYGKICITGDLLGEIKSTYELRKGNGAFVAGGIIGLGIGALIPAVGFAELLFGALLLTVGGIGNAPVSNYVVRDDMNLQNPDTELWLIHKKTRDELYRNKWKGVVTGSANSIDSLEDMMKMKVDNIIVNIDILNRLLDKLNQNEKQKVTITMKHFEKYNGYIGKKIDDNRFKFTRIR